MIEDQRQRRLIVGGETLSVYPLRDDWSQVHRDYWWQAFVDVTLPPRPSALMVGLGGGTQIHVLHRLAEPRRLTVVERDPVIIDVAREWFGIDAVPRIEFCCGDAADIVPGLVRLGRRFDFIMEDAAYGDDVDGAIELARRLADLVSPRGTLVLNRHWRRDAQRAADALTSMFRDVRSRRVKREGENVLIYCTRRRRAPRSSAATRG